MAEEERQGERRIEEEDEAAATALTTQHLYYDDTELFNCTAHVTGQWETEVNGETRTVLVLDRTVMHPQGGVCVYVCVCLSLH